MAPIGGRNGMPSLSVVRLFCVLLMVFAVRTAQAETFDKIVAVVNGEVILYSDLQDQLQFYLKSTPEINLDSPAKRSAAEREVLQQLIREKLAAEEVKRYRITVGNLEVEEAIADLKKERNLSDEQLKQMIAQDGKNMEQFREGIKRELERGRLLDRVLKSKTVITEEQINAQMGGGASATAGTKAKVVEKEAAQTVRLALIVIPKPKGSADGDKEKTAKLARDVRSQAKDGTNFGDLAMKYSRGPAAETGGDIGFVEAAELSPEIRDAVNGLKTGEISDLIETGSAFYVVKLVDSRKSKGSAVSESPQTVARDKVRRELYNKELSRKFEEWIRDLQSRASIQIYL